MKAPSIALLLVAAATTLGAQQSVQANPISAAFRRSIAGVSHNIEQAFDSIPESKFGFRPTPAQLSIGYIAQHVADDNYVFCSSFGALKPEIPADAMSTPDTVKATWPKAKLVEQLKASFAYCDKAIDQVTDATLAEQTSITYMGKTHAVGRASMVLGHALDLADHYSQLANYMRLNGILPPTALPRPRSGGGE